MWERKGNIVVISEHNICLVDDGEGEGGREVGDGNTLKSDGQAILKARSTNGVQLPMPLEDAEPIM